MSQYTFGSVSVTNGSAVVTGTSTEFTANVDPGDTFKVIEDDVFYYIASVDSDTQITLTSTYQGATKPNVPYLINKDFSANLGLYLPNKDDKEPSFGLADNFNKLDNALLNNQRQVINIGAVNEVEQNILTLVSDATDALNAGLTISNYRPTIYFKDRSAGQGDFAVYANGSTLNFDSDASGAWKNHMMLSTSTTLTLKGNAVGDANICDINFRQSDGSRTGYIGDSWTTDQLLLFVAEKGAARIMSTAGDIENYAENNILLRSKQKVFVWPNATDVPAELIIKANGANQDSILQLLTNDSNNWKLTNDISWGNALDFHYNDSRTYRFANDGELRMFGSSPAITFYDTDTSNYFRFRHVGSTLKLTTTYDGGEKNALQLWNKGGGRVTRVNNEDCFWTVEVTDAARTPHFALTSPTSTWYLEKLSDDNFRIRHGTNGARLTLYAGNGDANIPGIMYQAKPGFTQLTLQNGWQHVTGVELSYSKFGDGIVQLSGRIKSGTNTDGTLITTLPVGVRPPRYIYTVVQIHTNTSGSLRIGADGTVKVSGDWPSGWVYIHVIFKHA